MNIILVDDNPYIIEGLKAGVDYNSIGITGIYEARSMAEAMNVMQSTQIDIALTDIEMPNGTGLDLLEWINQNQPKVVTMFCTSYADFDYAKKAIELRCFEYYLKPIEYDCLYELLKKAVAEVTKRKAESKKGEMAKLWLKNEGVRRNHFWQDVFSNDLKLSESEFAELAIARDLNYYADSFFTVGVLCFSEESKKLKELDYSIQKFILQNVLEETFATQNLKLEGLIKGTKSNTWIIVLLQGDNQSVLNESDIEELFKLVIYNCTNVLKCPASAIYSVHKKMSELCSHYLEIASICEQEEIMIGSVYNYFDFLQSYEGGKADKDVSAAVLKVKQYLDEHYNEDICREDLGHLAYHNSAYLAKMFKQYIGKSMGNYLLDKRIKMACSLLEETNRSISDISIDIGYDNLAYFSRLFKKKTGMTPSEYRTKK